MKRWEYLVTDIYANDAPAKPLEPAPPPDAAMLPDDVLGRLGAQGWELAATVSPPGFGRPTRLYFKRPVSSWW